jgi:hypothetical protein
MKLLFCAMISGVLLGGTALAGDRLDDSKPDHKHSKHQRAREKDRDTAGAAVGIHFSAREIQVIKAHYAPRYRSLPPGLQKKLRRGGQLPPGWRKKLEPFAVVVERELVALPSGYRRGVIDGHAVIYKPGTQVIIDVVVLF